MADRCVTRATACYADPDRLGERSHLISNDVTLDVFVQDLVNVFEWEDLNDAILVRHSFGGIASTGAPSGPWCESARELEEPHRR